MSTPEEDLLSAFDGQDVESVRVALLAGADPCSPIRGKTPIYWLLGEHTRSERLGDCLRLLLERGAKLDDPVVALCSWTMLTRSGLPLPQCLRYSNIGRL